MHTSRRKFLSLGWLVLSAPLMAGPKNGKGKGKGKPHKSNHSQSSAYVDVAVVIGEHRRIVADYVDHYSPGGLPPGLAKRGGSLPPGLQKHLRKNGTLPPGLQKKISPYPPALARRLPALPVGYEGGFLEGRVVIFNRRTAAIFDIFIP